MEDTSPLVPPVRRKRIVTIQEINDPPSPTIFDTTVTYPSDALPEWFRPLQPVLEDLTVDCMTFVLGGGRVRYHLTVRSDEQRQEV